MTKIINYESKSIPAKIEQLNTYEPSLNEWIEKNELAKKEILQYVISIAVKYLKLVDNNILQDADRIKILAETIIAEFGNLEMQEIEFVFKKGATGQLGTIYKTVDIATITGIGDNCWFENYYKNYRSKRPDCNPFFKNEKGEYVDNSDVDISANAITYDEFIKKNPDKKDVLFLSKILREIKDGKSVEFSDVCKVMKIKGIKVDEWYNKKRGEYKGQQTFAAESEWITVEGNNEIKKLLKLQ